MNSTHSSVSPENNQEGTTVTCEHCRGAGFVRWETIEYVGLNNSRTLGFPVRNVVYDTCPFCDGYGTVVVRS